ncbi:hypothetical protein EJ04DRAFT_580520 [Polyplosphaeria fusca]|uniref:Fungal N-terminal domain-containing protein n=1 Tax=Polyplosphaeria fusca TaxID=682080 RepID=A0A9P4UV40_9PLEO|nr:hypothetical protein EJ04DRAFT_580520 [Polyplosphaeria fusca]
MAELLGIAASIIQIAGAGTKLSTTLYNFVGSAVRAEHEVADLAHDVDLTLSALSSVGRVFESEDARCIVSKRAILDANNLIKRCESVFGEIQEVLDKRRKTDKDGKKTLSTFGKLSWPMKEQRIELLRRRLESLKNSLSLLLHVLQLASSQAKGLNVQQVDLIEERKKIRQFHQAQQDSLERLRALEERLCKVNLDDDATLQGSVAPSRVPTIDAIDSSSQTASLKGDVELTDDSETYDSDDTIAGKDGETVSVHEVAKCTHHVQRLLSRLTALQRTLEGAQSSSRLSRNRITKMYRRFCSKMESELFQQPQTRVDSLPLPEFMSPTQAAAMATAAAAGPADPPSKHAVERSEKDIIPLGSISFGINDKTDDFLIGSGDALENFDFDAFLPSEEQSYSPAALNLSTPAQASASSIPQHIEVTEQQKALRDYQMSLMVLNCRDRKGRKRMYRDPNHQVDPDLPSPPKSPIAQRCLAPPSEGLTVATMDTAMSRSNYRPDNPVVTVDGFEGRRDGHIHDKPPTGLVSPVLPSQYINHESPRRQHSEEEPPLFVNPKQFDRILKRRLARPNLRELKHETQEENEMIPANAVRMPRPHGSWVQLNSLATVASPQHDPHGRPTYGQSTQPIPKEDQINGPIERSFESNSSPQTIQIGFEGGMIRQVPASYRRHSSRPRFPAGLDLPLETRTRDTTTTNGPRRRFPCTVPNCDRVGPKAFTWRTLLTEHLRNIHKMDTNTGATSSAHLTKSPRGLSPRHSPVPPTPKGYLSPAIHYQFVNSTNARYAPEPAARLTGWEEDDEDGEYEEDTEEETKTPNASASYAIEPAAPFTLDSYTADSNIHRRPKPPMSQAPIIPLLSYIRDAPGKSDFGDSEDYASPVNHDYVYPPVGLVSDSAYYLPEPTPPPPPPVLRPPPRSPRNLDPPHIPPPRYLPQDFQPMLPSYTSQMDECSEVLFEGHTDPSPHDATGRLASAVPRSDRTPYHMPDMQHTYTSQLAAEFYLSDSSHLEEYFPRTATSHTAKSSKVSFEGQTGPPPRDATGSYPTKGVHIPHGPANLFDGLMAGSSSPVKLRELRGSPHEFAGMMSDSSPPAKRRKTEKKWAKRTGFSFNATLDGMERLDEEQWGDRDIVDVLLEQWTVPIEIGVTA